MTYESNPCTACSYPLDYQDDDEYGNRVCPMCETIHIPPSAEFVTWAAAKLRDASPNDGSSA